MRITTKEDTMNKMTHAYQLGAMTTPTTIALDKKNKIWYPLNDAHYKDTKWANELFVSGKGTFKIAKWKREIIQPLEVLTAEALKPIYDKYGFNAVLGMVKGWSNSSMFHDHSIGLSYVQYEVLNMALIGKPYDTFTDKVQEIGDHFVEELLKNGFKLEGNIVKGSLWYNYVDENNYGKLVGFVGLYEKIHLHPLQYIEHNIGRSFMSVRMPPNFDPISFDEMLMKLFQAKYYDKEADDAFKKSEDMLKEIVSTKDRIAHLTNDKVAEEIASIFDIQKESFDIALDAMTEKKTA